MVWGRMGLLDEAIRDHLELKRRRGADPGEIAREEREALEPVFPDEPRPAAFEAEPQPGPVLDEEPPHGDPLIDAAPAPAAPVPAASQPAAQDRLAVGQETAELDMEAVLAQDARLAEQAAAPTVLPDERRAGLEDDLLEWETPGGAPEPPSPPLPGQESLSFE